MKVRVLYNEPTLAADEPDAESEAGVLESVEAVCDALRVRGHCVTTLGLPGDPRQVITAIGQLPAADVVFNLFEGFGGLGRGEAEVAGLVELCGHAMTGSGAECLALARDKARTKWLLQGAGVPTAPFWVYEPKQSCDRRRTSEILHLAPVIVKPAREDASLGIGAASVVETHEQLATQIAQVHQRYGAALVEQFIAGREFNVAIVALPSPEVLPLAEIEFDEGLPAEHRIVTYAAKWESESAAFQQTPVCCPAHVAPELAAELRRVSLAAYALTGCRDYARVDLRVDDAGRVYVLEVNANPDIGPGAGFARALRIAGIPYGEFIENLATTACARR